MQAQIVLTPTESKKLIARAVLKLPKVQRALNDGMLVLHPSSSTVFIYEEIFNKLPEGLWVCGLVAPRGLTGSREAEEMILSRGPGAHDPRKVSRQAWQIKKGILQSPAPLGEILDKMGEQDIYVKGVNAIDADRKAGVLFANPHGGGGTIGRVMEAQKKNGFNIIIPAGLDKLISGSIIQACHGADRKAELVMGLPCGLYPISGEVMTEIEAISILSGGAVAKEIASGGIGGAEGAVVLAVDGDDKQVTAAFEAAMVVKGAQLPELRLAQNTRWMDV